MTVALSGQMLMEDRIEKGEFKNMQELIHGGVLTIESAAIKQVIVGNFRKGLGNYVCNGAE